MEKEKDLLIQIEDRYGEKCFDDSTVKIMNSRNPTGFVEIYELDEKNERKLVGKSNLVVYIGREWLMSKAFNIQNIHISPTSLNEFLCWFGLGSGGCTTGNPLDPIPPTNGDTGLTTPVGISATDSTCADFHNGFYYKHPFDSITYEQDPLNGNCWIISKVTVTISAAHANGNNLNEAGLFTALSNTGGTLGNFSLWAKMTFPTIVKNPSRQLVFVWYLYF